MSETTAVLIRPDAAPEPVRIPAGDRAAFQYLSDLFSPDAFDAIRLGKGVDGYVGDSSLLDGSPHNAAACGLADACYMDAAGREFHACIHGPMVVLGVTPDGAATSVPAEFLAQFLPGLVAAGAPS